MSMYIHNTMSKSFHEQDKWWKRWLSLSCFSCKPTKPNYMKNGNDILWEDTCEFVCPVEGGRVIKVYDGDTLTIATKLPFPASPLYRLSVRLRGIDTPEMRGASEDEKQAAKLVRDFVHGIAHNKYVQLRNVQSEKYGRLLADVYVESVHLNELLLLLRYAVKYDGGPKVSPTSWLKYRLCGEMN
jgi:micrococcal nuclease